MAQHELKRQIGLFDAVMLISGDMIGIGIFVTTGVIAETLPTPGGVLLVWALGGLLALTGALSCAELSASLPFAGGDYIYIREAYGRLTGFLSGWSSFLVTFSGAIAFLAPQVPGIAAGFTIIWALAWRHQDRAVTAIEERDGVTFYVEPTSPVRPIELVRTPGFRREVPSLNGSR